MVNLRNDEQDKKNIGLQYSQFEQKWLKLVHTGDIYAKPVILGGFVY